jgi:hypothetical protein
MKEEPAKWATAIPSRVLAAAFALSHASRARFLTGRQPALTCSEVPMSVPDNDYLLEAPFLPLPEAGRLRIGIPRVPPILNSSSPFSTVISPSD